MTNRESSAVLTELARRLQNDPRYMSYVLAAYRRQENLTDEELAQELGTLPALVVRLALCQRPVSSSPQFAAEVRALADFTLTDEGQLAAILRQIDGLEKLATRPHPLAAREESPPRHSLEGLLAAARDRETAMNDEDLPPAEETGTEEEE